MTTINIHTKQNSQTLIVCFHRVGRMKLLIAVPTSDYIHHAFVRSLLALTKRLDADGIEYEVEMRTGSLVYDAREQLAAKARFENFSHVLWLDSDMVFPDDIFAKLSAHNKDYVTGICHARRKPYLSAVFSRLEPEAMRFHRTTYPQELFQIAASGFACVLTSVQLLRDIKNKSGILFLPTLAFGEDLAFCMRATEAGHELFADPAVQIKHIGHIEIGAEDEIIGD